MSKNLFLDSLEDLEKHAVLFLIAYQEVRQQVQRGYSAFKFIDKTILQTPAYKQAIKIVSWLEQNSYDVKLEEVNWKGFVEFVFEYRDELPMIPHFKNELYLKKYRKSTRVKNVEATPLTDKELHEMYANVLRAPFNSYSFKSYLGLNHATITTTDLASPGV